MPASLFRTTLLSFSRSASSLRLLLWLLLAPLCLLAWGASEAATTYYVRTDGGSNTQCTGRTDAKYPGSGSGQACAWKHPFYALPPNGSPRIAGGDTLIIGSGSYMIGWGAPGISGSGRCYAGGSYGCYFPPIPSGLGISAKTRILGKGYNTGCTAPPKFWGTERVNTVFNLHGSDYVEIGCLEITDQSDCVEFHSNGAARCRRDSAPYGAWASVGISASDSNNVKLYDLDIHGLANRGILAGGLRDWALDRVKINANGWAGWDGDIGGGSSNSGLIQMRDVEIAWNGCGERWQTGEVHACWAQESGGYGDGLGTATTGGQWVIEDSFIHHNTSDGLDLLYLDGGANTSATLRRVHAMGNAGNQIKTRGTTLIENSIVVGNCAYFKNKYDMLPGDQCRALGNALSVGLVAGQTATVRYNTVIGEGDCLILSSGGGSTSRINIQNNALNGELDYWANVNGNPGELSCGHYADNSPAIVSFTKNAFWHVKNNQCPTGSICGQHPKLTNMSMPSFNAVPLTGSPLINKAQAISSVNADFLLQPRPVGPAPDVGAVEKQNSLTSNSATSDFNGDSDSDILWRHRNTGKLVIWRSGVVSQTLAEATSLSYDIDGEGDFNGDGKSDILWRNRTTGKLVIWKSGVVSQTLAETTDLSWDIDGVGDFMGDGDSDILWRNRTTGKLVIWRSGVVSQTLAETTSLSYGIDGVGDFNGDGDSDILWRHRDTGRLVIWKSGTVSQTLAETTDLSWDIEP